MHDHLVFGACSEEAKNFLVETCEMDGEQRAVVLNLIRKLEKENARLKEARETSSGKIETCKLFLKSFREYRKKLQEQNHELKLQNNALLAEARRTSKDEEAIKNQALEEYEKEVEKALDILVNYDYAIEEESKNQINENIPQSVNDKTYKGVNSTKSLVMEGLPGEIQQQIDKLSEFDREINNIFCKKIAEVENENKLLTEVNRKREVDLKILKSFLEKAQADVNNCIETNKKLKIEYKDLLAELRRIKTNNDDSNLLEEIPRKKCRRENETSNSIKILGKSSF